MTKLVYHRSGSGAPLLLIHGFPLDHAFWNPLLPHLEAHFDCVVPDLRGFGDSPAAERGYSLDEMAADLGSLLSELRLPAAFLAGHSMGGYVAMAFARCFGSQLLGLGILGSQSAADTPEKKAARYDTIAQVKRQGINAVLGMAEKLSANPEHLPILQQLIQRQSPAGVMGALQAMAERPDSLPALSALTVPIVIVHGLEDSLVPPARAREIKAALPFALLTELPGIGHSPPLESPEQTAAALKHLC